MQAEPDVECVVGEEQAAGARVAADRVQLLLQLPRVDRHAHRLHKAALRRHTINASDRVSQGRAVKSSRQHNSYLGGSARLLVLGRLGLGKQLLALVPVDA